jgi:hypothetical protein
MFLQPVVEELARHLNCQTARLEVERNDRLKPGFETLCVDPFLDGLKTGLPNEPCLFSVRGGSGVERACDHWSYGISNELSTRYKDLSTYSSTQLALFTPRGTQFPNVINDLLISLTA